MSKLIGIIAAMDEETQAIKKLINNINTVNLFELEFYKGSINNINCVLVKCGIGKVNSSRVTQILIDKFDIEYIINVGSAGGIGDNLNYGDIVIGSSLVQHDFDLTAFGNDRGYIDGVRQRI